MRVDESVKRNVEALFESMGMNMSTAVNMFFKQCLMEEALPFQPRIKRMIPLEEALREAQGQARAHGTSNMPLDEINGIIADCRRKSRRKQ